MGARWYASHCKIAVTTTVRVSARTGTRKAAYPTPPKLRRDLRQTRALVARAGSLRRLPTPRHLCDNSAVAKGGSDAGLRPPQSSVLTKSQACPSEPPPSAWSALKRLQRRALRWFGF